MDWFIFRSDILHILISLYPEISEKKGTKNTVPLIVTDAVPSSVHLLPLLFYLESFKSFTLRYLCVLNHFKGALYPHVQVEHTYKGTKRSHLMVPPQWQLKVQCRSESVHGYFDILHSCFSNKTMWPSFDQPQGGS